MGQVDAESMLDIRLTRCPLSPKLCNNPSSPLPSTPFHLFPVDISHSGGHREMSSSPFVFGLHKRAGSYHLFRGGGRVLRPAPLSLDSLSCSSTAHRRRLVPVCQCFGDGLYQQSGLGPALWGHGREGTMGLRHEAENLLLHISHMR